MEKELRFDANYVSTDVSNGKDYLSVEVKTTYSDEVLNNFEPYEIIDNYENIKELYEMLKKEFYNE